MEGSFNFKNIKPTLSIPTKQGKQLDTNFKKQIRSTGMPLKEEDKEKFNDKTSSLKKKIFKLDKMETLVHSDEMLSKEFDKLKGTDPELIFGYHWNESLLNLLFNKYILNSPKYLQKYKNTRAKQKTRRGEEGIAQLQNDLNKEKEASSGAEERKNDLMTAADKEELNELFGFANKATPAPTSPRSQNDQYFIDNNNRIVAVAPYLNQNQYRQIIQQYAGKPNVKQVPWFAALHGSPMTGNKPVQGVPSEVSDFNQQQAQQAQQQFGTVPAMEENACPPCPPAAKPFRNPNDPMASFSKLGETTGSGSSGAFSMGLDAVNKEISDRTYQNETTTSSSSGQYSGPGIWAKNPANSRFAHSPAWKGGKILEESVIKGDENYLTDATAFKKYITKVEMLDFLNENFIPEGNETIQQTAARMIGKLHQWAMEDPRIESEPNFQDAMKKYTYEKETGQAYVNPAQQQTAQPQQNVQYPVYQQQPKPAVQPAPAKPEPTAQWRQPVAPMAENSIDEHHLHTRQEKVDFIVQNNDGKSYEELAGLSDDEVEQLYLETEKNMGMNEIFGFGKNASTPAPTAAPVVDQGKLSGYKNHLINALRSVKFGSQIIASLDKIYNNAIEQALMKGIPPQDMAQKIAAHYAGNGSLAENQEDDKSELYREIEARLRPTDQSLTFDELQDVANQYGVDFEDASNVMMQVIADRHNVQQADVNTVVADALKELNHGVQNHVDFQQLMNYLHQNYDMSEYDPDQIEIAYEKLTRDPNQMALFEASNFKMTMVKDLKYTGKKASDKDSDDELESKDGLFKGKWNNNKKVSEEPLAEIQIKAGKPNDKFHGKGGVEFSHTLIPTSNGIKKPSLKKEGYGGDPEVGEDQYNQEREVSEFMTLEQQLKELTALKNAGQIDELKAKLNSMPVIPMAGHAGNHEELGHRDLEDLGYLRVGYDYNDGNHDLVITNVSNKPIAQLNRSQHQVYMIEPGDMMESKKSEKELISEKAESKKQQQLMGIVHAVQKGEMKSPSSKISKMANSMKPSDVTDFASTKHKGLPNHVKKDKKKVDEGLFGNSNSELNVDQIANAIAQFRQSPESQQLRDQFVKAKDFVKAKAGNIGRMPQLKMWLDQNMPQLSNYVGVLWGNWDLMPTNNNLSEDEGKMKINEKEYKELIKAKMKSSGKSLKHMSDEEKKHFFNEADGEYREIKESMIDDQPDSIINNQQDSIASTMNSDELNTDGSAPEEGGENPVDGVEEAYDTDDVKAKTSSLDRSADYSEEEPSSEDEPEQKVVTPAELHKSPAPQYYNQGTEDPQIAKDAERFRAALKAKYGVDSVSDLSGAERLQLMKSMNFADKKQAPDASNYAKSDADRLAYQQANDPTEMLDYLNKNVASLRTAQDFKKAAAGFKAATGKNMQHPMAIYGAIEKMSPEERSKFAGLENYFKTNMTTNEQLNEDRKPSAILNVEKLGAENAKNFKEDMPKEDALSQDKTYPHKDGLHKAAVWPDPSKFYIEQDPKKYTTAKSMADLEREQLEKNKGALNNIGNSTADGKNIPKRNLTKEEMYELAMNRGDGMQDIVYDNKPSEKFEKRMEQDMGENIYKLRQDKMDYKKDAPMYNKDTQPIEKGLEKEEDNKFAKGYNLHELNGMISAKMKDETGRSYLVEFKMSDVAEVKSVDEDASKLTLDGMGNSYSLVGKKINENVEYKKIVSKYDFYLVENKVVALEKTAVAAVETKQVVNESKLDKMKHLMNYNAKSYVDPSKSVKF
jgi:hypothetical protein